MSSRRVDRASVFAVLLIVASALSVFTAGGRELAAQEKNQKGYSTSAHGEGAASSGAAYPRNHMVKTNDYGRYDPSPAFSKPRFKLVPN
ncbi:hypothetical protein E2562_023796 [Oryza meyeriana var. granulata]|uniref:Uncharacterized protein n=1 Tax=Oryza meyeriana var. granulata TaxID=110450 RepID=A0A6G1C8N0_9ORYZ|nr:hypothetical protein E2562_023796 [Oryza meyeriana var. granulata]